MSQAIIRRALLSVSNKENLEVLARFLFNNNIEIISSGGTGQFLSRYNIPYTPIEKITGFGEAFGGRMKTLSFEIESAILYDRAKDEAEAKKYNINGIDLVVCNFYPFQDKLSETDEVLIENIDIGGPTMLRAAAKNHKWVVCLSSPNQYQRFISNYEQNKIISLEDRKKYALEAFQLSTNYELFISTVLNDRFENQSENKLRYGENPHQKAWLLKNTLSVSGVASAKIHQGKELSYNNYIDADAAWRLISDLHFLEPNKSSVCIIKHQNPCGVTTGVHQLTTLQKAWASDPVSSFGSIIAFSETLKLETVKWLSEYFVEVILAPSVESSALEYLKLKKNLRVLTLDFMKNSLTEYMFRSVGGGILVQTEDQAINEELRQVTSKNFPQQMHRLVQFGIVTAKHLKSNAISLVQMTSDDFNMVGAGMGQPNRVDSLEKLAVARAKSHSQISKFDDVVLISDAFFPFSDTVEKAYEAGIRYIVQPGGSKQDEIIIKKCDELEVAMVFTGRRHFRH